MKSHYEKLVEEQGQEAANEFMRKIRAKRKVNKGGGFNDPKTIKKALDVRAKKKLLPDSETGQERQ